MACVPVNQAGSPKWPSAVLILWSNAHWELLVGNSGMPCLDIPLRADTMNSHTGRYWLLKAHTCSLSLEYRPGPQGTSILEGSC